MVFTVSFFFAVCLVLSVTFQGECNQDDNGKALIRRKRGILVQDFMDDIEQQMGMLAKRIKAKVLWIDFDGDFLEDIKNPKEKQKFKKMKINIFSGPTHYSKAPTKMAPSQKADVKKATRCNSDGTKTKTMPIKIPIEKTNTYSWELGKNFALKKKGKNGVPEKDIPINMKFEIPDFANADSGMQGGVEMKSTHHGAFRKDTTDKQELIFNVSIDPLSVMRMDIEIQTQEVELPFVSELIMEGFIAVRYNQKVNGSHLQFYPVYKFANILFRRRDDGVVFNCSGVFKGGRGVETLVYTYDEDLNGKECPKDINI